MALESTRQSVTGTTLVDGLVSRLQRQIDQGQLAPGTKLRSIRECASTEAVSRNTVVEAYERLAAMGYVEARQGAGVFVRAPMALVRSHAPRHVIAAVDGVSLLREQLERHYEVRVGDGRPPASWMEGSELGRHLHLPRTGAIPIAHGYGNPWGHTALRESIALLLGERSIQATPQQILLTHGANHALDLVIRHFLSPGDRVLVDSPGYYPMFSKLCLNKAVPTGVRRLSNGPDLDHLEALAAEYRPKLFFTQSVAHNPTGGSLTLPVAHRLLQLAERYGFMVIEDDPFGDLANPASPRLATLDQLDRVIYVSSFSKTLSASIRVGYVAASSEIAQSLCNMKMVTTVSSSDYVERLVHHLIVNGQYRRHLRRLRSRLDGAVEPAMQSLARLGLEIKNRPDGGYYIWAELPETLDEEELVRRAANESIFLAPGHVFMADRSEPHVPAMRINVAYANDPRFLRFMRNALKDK